MRNLQLALLLFLSLNLVAQKKGLLWKIEKEGHKTSYLFGTIHIQAKQVFSFDSTVYQSIQSVDQIQTELDFDNVNMMSIMSEMIMPDGLSIDSLYKDKNDLKTVNNFLNEQLGPQASMLKQIRPLFITSLIAQMHLPQEKPEALDLYIYNYGKNRGIKVGGLETLEEQMSAFNAIPLDVQAKGLLEMAKDYDDTKIIEENNELIKLYLNQDLSGLNKMINEMDDESKVFEEKLLTERNHTMSSRMIESMKVISNFFAVGAGHLGGDEGLIALLKKEGFTVTQVPFSFQGQ